MGTGHWFTRHQSTRRLLATQRRRRRPAITQRGQSWLRSRYMTTVIWDVTGFGGAKDTRSLARKHVEIDSAGVLPHPITAIANRRAPQLGRRRCPRHTAFPPPWSVDHSPNTRRVCSIRISSAILVRDSRTNSANGAFGRHDLHDSDGKSPALTGPSFATARPQISGVGG
jgi:hypothetical protein